MLTLISATGCRPKAFAICEKLMRRQTFAGAVTWIIVDDGETAQQYGDLPENFTRVIVRPKPHWRPGDNTLGRNMLAGLALAEGIAAETGAGDPRIVVIEDDDWYSPDWLETCAAALDEVDLFGEARARYYNVSTRRFRELSNSSHASLCSTAMTRGAIPCFRAILDAQKNYFYDIDLWRVTPAASKALLKFPSHVVGIKGMPGRQGIGMGHQAGTLTDEDYQMRRLEQWIGEDIDLYREFYTA